MYSASKTPVSFEIAQTLVAQHFGGAAHLRRFEELKDGYFNAAYLLELADGLKAVLKVAPPETVRVLRYEKNLMQAEVEALRLVKQHTNVPVPAIHAYDTSRRALGSDFFLMEFIPGVPLNKLRKDLPAETQATLDRTLGQYLRQMNSLTGPTFGYFAQPERRSPSWRIAFTAMLQSVLRDGQDMRVTLPLAYAELEALIEQHAGVLDEVTTPQLVHWDMWDGNIFVEPATGHITGFVDFERALWADPLIEATFASFQAPGIAQNILEGYGLNLLGTATQKRRRNLYDIYVDLIMIIECAYRQYETNDQENWARGLLDKELEKLKNGN